MPFLDTLAAGILEQVGADPLRLSAVRVLLPTRRACRALRDSFLRLSGGRPLLLPRLTPLGDVDEEELVLAGAGFGADADLAPAIPGLTRQLILTRLVLAAQGGDTADQAARLAAALAHLLDEVQTEGVSFDGLKSLVPAEYAAHWQKTLAFLELVTALWPQQLAATGCLDPADRRNRLLSAQARAWTEDPPATPVIAAGSTGSIPATAALLAVVARLPAGTVVLPGFDGVLAAEADALEPSHPQYGLYRLLDRLGVRPEEVTDWPAAGPGTAPARAALLREALRPWSRAEPGGLAGLKLLECAGPQEEAGAIALLLREALEIPGRRAALVTPDRTLARRVAAELARWDIAIDDSAGLPLAQTPPGTFLRLTAAMIAEGLAPVPLLSALKHPLAAGGQDPGRFRALVRRLELRHLRGPRPAPGFGPLRAAEGEGSLAGWLASLERLAAPFSAAMGAPRASLGALLRAHLAFAEALAGPERLWAGEAGEAAAGFVAELLAAAETMPALAPRRYPALFETLLAGPVVRPQRDRHPRLSIWGPLEARLQHADLMILGGLNEGTWPAEPPADPWMSRPMRQAFGLSPPERRIGLSAHDFAQAFNAPEVVLTRATRVEGTPTVSARWLERLVTFLGAEAEKLRRPDVQAWQEALDAPAGPPAPAPAPMPRPPVAARPRRLSVTEIETWMRDPYALYARHILRLQPLDPIDADPGAAEYGTVIHRALEKFLTAYPDRLPADGLDRLLAIGRETFGAVQPGLWAFWWPRFERIATWFIATEAARRPALVRGFAERKGEMVIDAPAGLFTLSATADRIEETIHGGLVVIDYKTGAVASWTDVQQGFSPQLPLEGAIIAARGFPGLPSSPVESLQYWQLKGGEEAGRITRFNGDPLVLAGQALAGLKVLVAEFDDPLTPYPSQPRPEKVRFGDFDHLARVREWATGAEEEE